MPPTKLTLNTPIVNCVTRQTRCRPVAMYSAGPTVLGLSESARPTEIATPIRRSIACHLLQPQSKAAYRSLHVLSRTAEQRCGQRQRAPWQRRPSLRAGMGSVSNDVRAEAMSARLEAVWAASGAFAVGLFACGLLFGDLLGTTNFPALNATPSELREYFLRNVSEVRALSFFHLLAAAALAAFASYLYARYAPLASASLRSRSPVGSSPRRSWQCLRSATGCSRSIQ